MLFFRYRKTFCKFRIYNFLVRCIGKGAFISIVFDTFLYQETLVKISVPKNINIAIWNKIGGSLMASIIYEFIAQ